jgi:hypothetical protein
MNAVIIVLAFAFIGAGLKYIDDAFDEDTFSKKKALALAPLVVLVWVSLSLYDSISATILFSILLAVLLSGKIDNLIFKVCAIVLVSILVLTQMLNLLWAPLVFLVGLLVMCALSVIPWLYLLAFLAHDGAYETVRMIGKKHKSFINS